MRKLWLMFIAVLILVVMVFAMTQGSALGLGKAEPECPQKAKADVKAPFCEPV